MIHPDVLMRAEQRYFCARIRVNGTRSVRLMSVARRTGKTKIRERRLPASRARRDVLDFENGGAQLLRGSAIGAAIAEVLADAATELKRNVFAHPPVAPLR